MSAEEQRLKAAAERASGAINELLAVLVEQARIGRYPESLIGRGWMFAIEARDELRAANAAFRPAEADCLCDDIGTDLCHEPGHDKGRL